MKNDETSKTEGTTGNDAGTNTGMGGGKFAETMAKMGPLLENKEMFFSLIDNALLPHLDDILERYVYGSFLQYRARYFFTYFEHLKKTGFSNEMAEELVLIAANKESLVKELVNIIPELSRLRTKKKQHP